MRNFNFKDNRRNSSQNSSENQLKLESESIQFEKEFIVDEFVVEELSNVILTNIDSVTHFSTQKNFGVRRGLDEGS